MEEFKSRLLEQRTEIDELQRLIRNYGKDGEDRKNKRYLDDKLKTFAEYFTLIKANHAILSVNKPDDKQAYFTEKTFENIEALYSATIENIQQRLEKLKNPNTTINPSSSNKSASASEFTFSNPLLVDKSLIDENASGKSSDDIIETPPIDVNSVDTTNLLSNEESANIDQSKPKTPINDQSFNLSGSWAGGDVLTLQYQEVMELLVAAHNFNLASSHGEVRAFHDNLKSTWNEFRAEIYRSKAAGKELEFSYNLMLQKYMTTSGKLIDILTPSKAINDVASSKIQFALPTLKLPEFTGKPSEWKGFISLFDRMVHSNDAMDNGLKIEYLKTQVKGEAAKILNHIDPTPNNYLTCYALLRKRYDNKRESLGIWIENIFNLPKMQKEDFNMLKAMHDTVYESIMSIKNIGVSVSNWDALLCHVLTKKLDQATLVHYECQLENVRELQSLSDFLRYLENRFMALKAAGAGQDFGSQNTSHYQKQNTSHYQKQNTSQFQKQTSEKLQNCLICNQNHSTSRCQLLLTKGVQERIDLARTKKICLNCLSGTHKTHDCKSQYTCKTCKKHHHSLLHLEQKIVKSNMALIESEPVIICSNIALERTISSVLLATALIGVRTKYGEMITLRALLDQGSQSAFITEQAVQTLKIKRESINAIVAGIGGKRHVAKHAIEISLFPRFQSEFSINTYAIIMPKLTQVSSFDYDENDFNFINNLTLADPSFLKESDIDIILGAAEYAQALKSGLIKSEKNLIAQNSEFGWMVSGALKNRLSHYNVLSMSTNVELLEKMNKFFDHGEFDNEVGETLTEEELMCEEHFTRTHRRDHDGRYVLMMPFKNDILYPDLGDSRRMAIGSLFTMERRFKANPELKIMYTDFINEYIKNGHMRRVSTVNSRAHYMPHHNVFKDSTTTKLRVVFNSSRKTSNGKSLNGQLALGPMDQNDLSTILLRWRRHKVAFTADVAQMYRQILIDETQTHLQRIVWRNNPNDSIED